MFRINKEKNIVESLDEATFSELGIRERENLQEWICHNPEMFGEELLIIQKEFDGFNETKERLDLLALDKDGNLVIIENKLDDSGRDVVWQSLKYASYCSNLTKAQIIQIYQGYLNRYRSGEDAEENIQEFLEKDMEEIILNSGNRQKIYFVAANFRKEVTSTVLWLLGYGIHMHCYKVTPYKSGTDLFLNVEQIIPTPEAEDFMIGMSAKEVSEKSTKAEMKSRHKIRLDYWQQCLEAFRNSDCNLFNNVSPTKENWLTGGSGVGFVSYCLIFGFTESRVQINIARSSREENQLVYNYLHSRKEEIESVFGDSLTWSTKEGQISSYIKYGKKIDGTNRDNWPEIIEWHITHMKKLENAMQKHIDVVNRKLREG
jgi:hypothetical protein